MQEEDLYIYNALNQITLWGPYPQGNLDYAIKQWSGVVTDYHLKRWQLFVDTLVDNIANNKTYDQDAMNWMMFSEVEEPFTLNTSKEFPSTVTGICIDCC